MIFLLKKIFLCLVSSLKNWLVVPKNVNPNHHDTYNRIYVENLMKTVILDIYTKMFLNMKQS